MLVQTKLVNPTKIKQQYGFIPKHGLILGPKQCQIIDGDIYTSTPIAKRSQLTDAIKTGRLMVIIITDTTVVKPSNQEKIPLVEKVVEKVVKKPTKESSTISAVDNTDNIVIPVETPSANPDAILDMNGNEIVDEPIFDAAGNIVVDEDPIDVMKAIQDGNIDEVMSIAVVGESAKDSKEVPSKTALNKLPAEEVSIIASNLGVDITVESSKKKQINAIHNK